MAPFFLLTYWHLRAFSQMAFADGVCRWRLLQDSLGLLACYLANLQRLYHIVFDLHCFNLILTHL
ncbi:MAG: hypothetical protein ACI883_001154 [Candidatus Azotimanducaceae bacterium]|jgi:hypothetical protein